MRPLAISSFLLLSSIAAVAQTVNYCPGEPAPTTAMRPDNDRVALPSGQFVSISRLGNQWMPNMPNSDGDSMTEPAWKRNALDPKWGSDGFHETWYIPKTSILSVSTTPLYEKWSNGAPYWDHMDTPHTNEAREFGYSTEQLCDANNQCQGSLGSAWASSTAGMTAIARYFSNTNNFDHLTWPSNRGLPTNYQGKGYYLEKTWTEQGLAAYGFPRYGNRPCRNEVFGKDVPVLANSAMTVTLNPVWGNVIRNIRVFSNGDSQIVSNREIGALVQSTVLAGVDIAPSGRQIYINPTEAGSKDGYNNGNIYRWVGSPILSTWSGSTTSHTVLQPFNFDTSDFLGQDQTTPLLWNGYFQKDLTLGYTDRFNVQHPNVLQIGFGAKLQDGVDTHWYQNGKGGMNHTFWLASGVIGGGAGYQGEVLHLDTGESEAIPWLPRSDVPPDDWTSRAQHQEADALLAGARTRDTALIVYNNKTDPSTSFAYGLLSSRAIYRAACGNDGQIAYYSIGIRTPTLEVIQLDTWTNHNLGNTEWSNEIVFFVAGTYDVVRQDLLELRSSELTRLQCIPGP